MMSQPPQRGSVHVSTSMVMKMKAGLDSVLWPVENTVAWVFKSLVNVLKGKVLSCVTPPQRQLAGPGAGQGLTLQVSATPLGLQTPTLKPNQSPGQTLPGWQPPPVSIPCAQEPRGSEASPFVTTTAH